VAFKFSRSFRPVLIRQADKIGYLHAFERKMKVKSSHQEFIRKVEKSLLLV